MADRNWCDALYFPYGRRKLGGVHCRLEPDHAGAHWCEAEDEMGDEMGRSGRQRVVVGALLGYPSPRPPDR